MKNIEDKRNAHEPHCVIVMDNKEKVFECETVDDVFNKIICSRKGNGFIKITDFLSGSVPLRKQCSPDVINTKFIKE